MKVYIAGPMTGIPHHNFPAFDAMAEKLRSKGFKPISPADITRSSGLETNSDGSIDIVVLRALFTIDLGMLTACQAIVLLRDWEKSRGAKIEAQIAAMMQLKFLDRDTLRPRPAPWLSIEVRDYD